MFGAYPQKGIVAKSVACWMGRLLGTRPQVLLGAFSKWLSRRKKRGYSGSVCGRVSAVVEVGDGGKWPVNWRHFVVAA